MVRVISAGPAPEVVKQVLCRNCGAVLEYTPHEVREYHGKDMSGGPDGQEWIDCPQCGKKVVLRSW